MYLRFEKKNLKNIQCREGLLYFVDFYILIMLDMKLTYVSKIITEKNYMFILTNDAHKQNPFDDHVFLLSKTTSSTWWNTMNQRQEKNNQWATQLVPWHQRQWRNQSGYLFQSGYFIIIIFCNRIWKLFTVYHL